METKDNRRRSADPTEAAKSDIGDAQDVSATAELSKANPRCEDTRLDATRKYYVDSNLEEESRHRSQLGEDEGGEARTGTGGQPTSLPLPEGKETVPPALQKERQPAEKQNACSTSCTLQKRQQPAAPPAAAEVAAGFPGEPGELQRHAGRGCDAMQLQPASLRAVIVASSFHGAPSSPASPRSAAAAALGDSTPGNRAGRPQDAWDEPEPRHQPAEAAHESAVRCTQSRAATMAAFAATGAARAAGAEMPGGILRSRHENRDSPHQPGRGELQPPREPPEAHGGPLLPHSRSSYSAPSACATGEATACKRAALGGEDSNPPVTSRRGSTHGVHPALQPPGRADLRPQQATPPPLAPPPPPPVESKRFGGAAEGARAISGELGSQPDMSRRGSAQGVGSEVQTTGTRKEGPQCGPSLASAPSPALSVAKSRLGDGSGERSGMPSESRGAPSPPAARAAPSGGEKQQQQWEGRAGALEATRPTFGEDFRGAPQNGVRRKGGGEGSLKKEEGASRAEEVEKLSRSPLALLPPAQRSGPESPSISYNLPQSRPISRDLPQSGPKSRPPRRRLPAAITAAALAAAAARTTAAAAAPPVPPLYVCARARSLEHVHGVSGCCLDPGAAPHVA